MPATIAAVHKSPTHTMQKSEQASIRLLASLGVEGDAHSGETVKHRSRVAKNPNQPNLRQVHLIHSELHAALREMGFIVAAGQMGENITTQGLDLLSLPKGTRLVIGESIIEITGLRNPCLQLEGIQKGLMKAVLDRDINGELIRKAGIMGIIIAGGEIKAGDIIQVELPAPPFMPLEPV